MPNELHVLLDRLIIALDLLYDSTKDQVGIWNVISDIIGEMQRLSPGNRKLAHEGARGMPARPPPNLGKPGATGRRFGCKGGDVVIGVIGDRWLFGAMGPPSHQQLRSARVQCPSQLVEGVCVRML